MPTYNFKHNDTGEVSEHTMSISQLDEFKTANPDLQQVHLSAPPLQRDSGRQKPDEGFREVLSGIKKASGRGANINTF